jgi:hypothetical protein
MTRVNPKLYTLEGVLEKFVYSTALERAFILEEIYSDLELNRQLLMADFDYDDVEAMQIVDSIELRQFYLNQNLEMLRQGMLVMQKAFFMDLSNIQIGLN